MLPALPLLCMLAGAAPTRLETWIAGGRERLSQPPESDWDEGEIGLALRIDRRWSALAVHGVRRYGIDDGEILASTGREHEGFGWEIGTGLGLQRTFLPSWALRGSLHKPLGRSWDASLSHKASVYEDLGTYQTEIGIDLSTRRISYGIRGGVPLADGSLLTPGWRILSDISWSERASCGASLGGWTEAESDDRGGIVRTRVASAALSSRLRMGASTIRIGTSWTRQGASHDRVGATLGLSRAFDL